MVKTILKKKISLKGYTLIEGFPGIGLIGTIAASFLAEKLNMELVGYIYSEKFPPMASIHDGVPYYPVRLYADKKNKIIVVFSDFVIPADVVYEMSNELINLFKKEKMKEIISLAGMTSTFVTEERAVYAIVSKEELKKKLEKLGIRFIQQGVTTGVSGVLLMKCAMEGLPAFSLLAESSMAYPDPGSAAFLLKKLGEYLGIKVETGLLEEEAKKIQERIQKTIEQVRAGKMKYKQAEEHLPMYG